MATEERPVMGKRGGGDSSRRHAEGEAFPGIVIAAGRKPSTDNGRPRIAAFIWGGKVRPTPTLPFGRWKGVA